MLNGLPRSFMTVSRKSMTHSSNSSTAFLMKKCKRWYVSVMLNRLMFIYFIQKKGFLDNNESYLHTKLTESQAKGTNRYYKEFLCPLFFEGFAKPEAER